MKIKQILCAFLLLLFALPIASCGSTANKGTTAEFSDTTETVTQANNDTAATTPYTEAEQLPPSPPDTLKVLAIGNSFSSDCMQYLYQIAKEGGVGEIVLGNLYYGGCTLQQHLSFANTDTPKYTYYKNTTGVWETENDFKISTAIKDENWDFIVIQQSSRTSGLTSSYGKTLTDLIKYIRSANSTATLVWNATWAYQQDSTHSAFPNYGKDQKKMYDMIVNCLKTCILPEEQIELIIPCGTAIQNLRTSFLGDTLTRDGYHLDYYIGRYTAALTWYTALTGCRVEEISFSPSITKITEDMMNAAKEAVTAALKTPYEVTDSSFKEGKLPEENGGISPDVILNPADFIEFDTAVAAANGVDLSGYTLFTWDYLENSYWYCTNRSGVITPASTSGTYKQNVCSAEKFSLNDIPIGSVFILDDGWQYRLEIFTSPNSKYTGKRPTLSSAQYFKLTEEFMGDCKYLAWNISSKPKTDISEIYAQAACRFRVYVPN